MPAPVGILPAAITPRHADSTEIDVASALELIDFLQERGVDGITLLGSTGEFPHFTPEDRMRLAQMAIKRSRVPVLVNVSHSTLEGAVEMGEAAVDSGAAGVLIMAPYYYRYTQDSIRAFCLEFAARVKTAVYLYNIPQFTSEIAIETALDLLGSGAFAGITDSSGRWENFERLQRSGLAVYTGADTMYSRAARAGATGAISGIASVVPELMVAIDRAARCGQDTAALDARVKDFIDRANEFPFPVAYREALKIRGIDAGPCASPVGPAESKRLEEFRGWFREWVGGVMQTAG
jgi:4-hydroxy-tetrahydrodipicolinate synthase